MISIRGSTIAVTLFVTLAGPVLEEIMFRGFLYPLLERAAGPWPALLRRPR